MTRDVSSGRASRAAVHHPECNREEQEADCAAPEADGFEQKRLVREGGDRTNGKRQRREADEQPAECAHGRDYTVGRRSSGRGDVRDSFLNQLQERLDRCFQVRLRRVFFFAVRQSVGRVGEHHDDRHVRHHFRGVMQGARREAWRVAGFLAHRLLAQPEQRRIERQPIDLA